jgi:hypothetical protein
MSRCHTFRLSILLPALFLLIALSPGLFADAPPFDLVGPKVDVHVQRAGKTLPIAEVPNLLPGDRLWIHPDLPETQSAHYILIIAFLRGSTNPPPAEWFRRVETWSHDVREEGVFVVVPAEAQQAILFLAPETTGDFSTLRAAVRGRPGAFVRATQDLQQASWDRLRLDAYLAEIKSISNEDPKDLKGHTALAARSLGMRVDQQCFDKPSEQQAPCLVQHTDGLVLDDSNAQSVVTQIANGSTADLMNQLSYSSTFGAGQFSPYIGAVVDLARILSSVHTAKYQYIPALALPHVEQKDTLNLRLNVPPSFRDPKSVIVVALPPIGPSHPPQLHAPDVAQSVQQDYCATKPGLSLLTEGGPLAFATAMAHDMVLHVDTKAHIASPPPVHPELPDLAAKAPAQVPASKTLKPDQLKATAQTAASAPESGIDIPVHPDPTEGGFVLDSPLPALPEDEVVGELRGRWGFDSLEGPKYHLRFPHPGSWTVPSTDLNALITGREDTLHIQGTSTLCVAEVHASIPEPEKHTSDVKLTWKSPKPEVLEVAVPLKEAAPGTVTIAIHQYGMPKPETLPLKAYAEAAALEHITLSTGDKVAILKGKRLDEVESAELTGIRFTPSALNRVQDYDQLSLDAAGNTATLQPGNSYSAKVTLRDGRVLQVPTTVGVPRPQVELLSKGIQREDSEQDNSTHMGNGASNAPPAPSNPNDLPLQRRLVFFLRSRVPANFARSEKIEIASTDGSLILEDAHTAVAAIDPLARFGSSAFGPIQLRAVTAEGTTGDWVPVGTLVRLPGLKDLRCPRNPAKTCQLTGTNLFLITAVGSNPDMTNAVDVPSEFTGTTLTIPNVPKTGTSGAMTGTLYVRLRDDPTAVQALSLPVSTPTGPAIPATNTGSNTPANPAATSTPAPTDSGQSPTTGASTSAASGKTTPVAAQTTTPHGADSPAPNE